VSQEPEQQQMHYFFADPDGEHPEFGPPPTDDEIRVALAENNTKCPLNRIIVGEDNRNNMKNIRTLMCFPILKRYNHCPKGHNFGLYCPPGQGKTFIYKRIAETLGIISVFVQSASIDNNFTLFETIRKSAAEQGYPIVPYKTEYADFTLPPMLIFFDEAHKLPMAMMKGGLLNAMEPDDAIMEVRMPGKKGETFRVDCDNVCWCAATTDRGDLFDAFEQRLLNPIQWEPATEEVLPHMIKQGLDAKAKTGEINLEVPLEACQIMARYQKVPRMAIHRFGTKVAHWKDYSPSDSWEEACLEVAKIMTIDEGGLTKQQVEILRLLGDRPCAEKRLPDLLGSGKRLKEIQKYELPGLQQYYDGGPFIRSISGIGMCITRAGLLQLENRGIRHNGEKVTAEYIESRR
jgi:hypothetical protein